jgi:hypothetical protein
MSSPLILSDHAMVLGNMTSQIPLNPGFDERLKKTSEMTKGTNPPSVRIHNITSSLTVRGGRS